MRSFLVAAVVSAMLAFGMGNAVAKSAKHRRAYLGTKCFGPLELKVDKHDNVFAFFQNVSVRDLRSMPYHYFALEVYGFGPKRADAFYHSYRLVKKPISISSILGYLRNRGVTCHVRGETPYWPKVIYYSCMTKMASKGLAKR